MREIEERVAKAIHEAEHGSYNAGIFKHMNEAYRRAARAAIAAMPGWQPIATAPKNGDPVLIAECSTLTDGTLLWYIDTAVNCFELDVREIDVWKARESNETVCYAPTHWMPLPTPPEAPAPIPQQQTSGSKISNNCPQNTTQEKT